VVSFLTESAMFVSTGFGATGAIVDESTNVVSISSDFLSELQAMNEIEMNRAKKLNLNTFFITQIILINDFKKL